MKPKENKTIFKVIGNGCGVLFILIFLIVGIWPLYLSITNFYLQNKTKDWIPIEAHIKDVDFITTYHTGSSGKSYEVKCSYTYIIENNEYTNNTISIGYGSNNTENHNELYELLRYNDKVTAYVNPEKYENSTLAKGVNSSTTSLLIFSILWNGFILIFLKNKNKRILIIFALLFISGLLIIISGVTHTNFKEKINIIDKKSKKEIEEIKRKQFEESIERYENS